MQTTTYGYKKPQQGDRAKGSSGWYAAINYNTDRLDGHNHDGSNSASLSISAIAALTATVSAGSWSVSGNGYVQTVTVPAGITEVNNYSVKFVATAPAGIASEVVYLQYKRLTATTIRVYSNDNTLAATAVFR